MNNVQKNFKKQISQSEKFEHSKAKKGKGAFSNKLFLLRYYGYNHEEKKPKLKPKGIFEAFVFIIKSLYGLIKLIILLAIVLVIAVIAMAAIYTYVQKK